jgi:hypothetical protein
MPSITNVPAMRSLIHMSSYSISSTTILVRLAALYKLLLSYKYWYLTTFLYVFLFRYIRVFISLNGTFRYRPAPLLFDPTYQISDITIIIPTTNLMSTALHNVVRSVLVHPIPKVIISTAGTEAAAQMRKFKAILPDPRLLVLHRDKANRCNQTVQALKQVETRLIILQDDHTY